MDVRRRAGDLVEVCSVRVNEIQIVLSVLFLMRLHHDPPTVRRPVRTSSRVELPRGEPSEMSPVEPDREYGRPAAPVPPVEDETLPIRGVACGLRTERCRAWDLVAVCTVGPHLIDSDKAGVVVESSECDAPAVGRPSGVEILDTAARFAHVMTETRQV